MATTNFNISNNVVDNKSFAVLRTNPKFTSNVKLVIDANENLFLSSFRANKSLSRSEYQKFGISPNGNYSTDVHRFYNNLPLNERYFNWRKLSDLTTYSEYSSQYEDQYQYGAAFNTTKVYDEQYKLLAPIWLDKKIPSNFVIWRVEDTDYKNTYSDDNLGQNARILELLKNATIVKSYDLTRTGNLGNYLYKHVYNDNFPTAPISFNFDPKGVTSYNGIDIQNGGFASKNEYITSDYLIVDQPEIYANEYLTSRFESSGIISANLLNLEFMFDDSSAEDYKIYRYFGLYVDSYDEGEFDIDKISSDGLVYIKPNSYQTYYDLTDTTLDADDMLPTVSDLQLPILSYVKDRGGNFHHIKNNVNFNPLKIPVSINDTFDTLTGYVRTGNVIEIENSEASARGFLKVTIKDAPTINDRIFIADKSELKISKYNLNDYTILADPTLQAGVGIAGKFSTQGTLQQITQALANSIKFTGQLTYNVTVMGTSIVIEDNSAGYNRRRTAFGVNVDNITDFIDIEAGSFDNIGLLDTNPEIQTVVSNNTSFTNWNIWTPIGGAVEGAAFLINQNELGDVVIGQYVKQKDLSQFSKIISVVRVPFDATLYRVVIEHPIKNWTDTSIETYNIYKAKHGKFSAYTLKDFNFDFYDTSNSNLGTLGYKGIEDDFYPSDFEPTSYFSKLTPILQQDDVDDQIIPEDITSEYDRLDENKLKETAIKSRIVPTIMKFSLKGASNARNLPYILNVNEAFGTDNMSPNIKIKAGRNPEYFNMEHFHLNRIPSYYYDNQTLTKLCSNTSFRGETDGITLEQLKSVNVDYFTLYFTRSGNWDSSNSVWVDDKFKKIYSTFTEGSNVTNPSTIFRGFRYLYKKRKEYVKDSPTDFINSTEVNEYRFGVTLDYSIGNNNLVTYNVIKNDVHKFICVLIKVTVVDNKYTTLDRYLTYELEDIVDDDNNLIDIDIPFNIRLGYNLNDEVYTFSDTGTNPVYAWSGAVTDGSAKFTEYIKRNSDGVYSWLLFEHSSNTWGMKVVDVLNDSQITVSGKPILFQDIDGVLSPTNIKLDNPVEAESIFTPYRYWKGGSDKLKNIFEDVVAYNFVDRFNQFGQVQYITVDANGEYPDRFVLEVEDGTEIIKASLTTKVADGVRPKSYQLTPGEIGKKIVLRNDGGYFIQMNRMNGEYYPLFNDIITFTDIFTEQKRTIPTNVALNEVTFTDEREYLIYNKFNNLGVAFESYKLIGNDIPYGFIKNVFYHKVNDENTQNLLKLSQTSDKLPLYPEIGEIAIDKVDINVFKSKYSATYFTKNLPTGGGVKVHGTLSPVEVKSYLASTVMKVQDVYELTTWSHTFETSVEALDYIRNNTLNTSTIHWTETDSQILADFYMPTSIIDKLISDGIKDKFKKYINAIDSFGAKDSIDDDLDAYIRNNIIDRFIIDNIEIYGIQGKGIGTEFISIDNSSELSNDNYLKLTNYETQQYRNDSLSFRLIYNKKLGYQYKLKVYVKIQA